MKKILVFLALSLAANAALLVTYFVRPTGRTSPSQPTPLVANAAPSPVAAAADGVSAADAATLKRARELIVGNDLHSSVTRLRAAGFSPALIRQIVVALVYEQFRERRAALLEQRGKFQYWKQADGGIFGDRKMALAYDALSKEQNALVKELLGSEGLSDEFARASGERQFGELAQEKIDRLQGITRDYSELRQQISMESRGVMLPEDREKMALIEKEQRADIEKLLTPAELEDYDLRNSNTSHRLRYQLAGFNPTEEEFRTIFRLSRTFDEANGLSPGMSPGLSPAERAARQDQVQAEIAAALGPTRAADYQQAMNPAFQEVNRLLTRLDLPSSIAPQVVSLQQDVMQRANAVRRDTSLSATDRASQFAALTQEAEAKLTSALGARGLAAYRTMGGHWLQSLAPRPSPGQVAPVVRLPGT